MLTMQAVGSVTKLPEYKTSPKGTAYLKFQVEVPLKRRQWPKKVGVTVFGKLAEELSTTLGLHAWVALSGDPDVRGFLNKEQKPTGFLEMVADTVVVLDRGQTAQQEVALPGNVQTPSFDESDIPF